MVKIKLEYPDLALFHDPAPSRTILRHLVAAPRQRTLAQAFVLFEGDKHPINHRGDLNSRTYDLTVRYSKDEHDELARLIALLDRAAEGPHNRLVFRTNFFDVPRLKPLEVGVAGPEQITPARAGSRAWDVRFPFTCVSYSLNI